MGNPPSPEEPLDDVSMAGADEEEEQEEDLPENVSQIMGHQDTLVIAHSMGFSITTSNGVLAQDLPTSHPTVQTCLFSASVIQPKTAFTFDVLDHFYMDSMECKTAGLSFFQS